LVEKFTITQAKFGLFGKIYLRKLMMKNNVKFSGYEVFIIVILSLIQFSVILDFMVLSPLGAILMPKLQISTKQFGTVVSAYAFSAGASGLLAAGYADRFDRKRFLLFFYWGFVLGTMACALAQSYEFLLIARIVTGIFGGVIGSVGFAIITDMFAFEQRGRVMGFTQMAFSASQILGLPLGLYLANKYDWHAPFWLIVAFGILMGLAIMLYMRPITGHLQQKKYNAMEHLWLNLAKPMHLRGFAGTVLLATGGFMLMPFGSAFAIGNLGLPMEQLPTLYFITGLFSIVAGPAIGMLTDKLGTMKVFTTGTILVIAMVLLYTNLGITPLWQVIVINIVLFFGIMARMIGSSTLISTLPKPEDRGAFMSINASIQQISGGVSSLIAGLIVYKSSTGKIENYPLLGWVVNLTTLAALGLIYWLWRHLKAN
jgi:predicted MFS family arabinose efflux permease